MAGLSLNVGGYGAAAVPISSNSPSSTIAQQAYGITTPGTGAGPRTAGLGTVSIGIFAAAVLTWLWYTLPR